MRKDKKKKAGDWKKFKRWKIKQTQLGSHGEFYITKALKILFGQSL